MAGRPPFEWTDAIIEELLSRISEGETLRTIARAPHMPSVSTIIRRVAQDEQFRRGYDEARLSHEQNLFEQLTEIASDSGGDWILDAETGDRRFNQEHFQRSRLRCDVLKWQLSKLNPRRYGEKVEVEQQVTVTAAPDRPPEELNRDRAKALALKLMQAGLRVVPSDAVVLTAEDAERWRQLHQFLPAQIRTAEILEPEAAAPAPASLPDACVRPRWDSAEPPEDQ